MNKAIAVLPDALIVAGGCAVSYGAWLIVPAAGFIVGGMLAIAGGWLAGVNTKKPKDAT